jgi:hypothetical protein
MFVNVKLASNLAVGTVVSYDSVNQNWNSAPDDSSMIGVIERPPIQDDDSNYWAHVRFSGSTVAIADQAIPNEGGMLCVSNGRVFVDNSMAGCGIVAPKIADQADRIANDLVMVNIR